jgi:hypothetical protein
VFLAERLKCFGRTFHRTCFKCARCSNQLSTANCYETESHAFCCEVCPDEEATERGNAKPEIIETSSDGEDDSIAGSCDDYSNNFESALEVPDAVAPLSDPALSAFLDTQLSQSEPITVTSSPDLPTISNINNIIKEDSHINKQHENLDRKSDGDHINCSTLKQNDENQSGIDKDLNSCDSFNNAQTVVSKFNNSDLGDSSLCSNSLEIRINSSGESNNSSLVSRRKSLFENLTQTEDAKVITSLRKSSLKSASATAQEDCTQHTSTHTAIVSDVNNPFLVSPDDTVKNKTAHIKDDSDESESQINGIESTDATKEEDSEGIVTPVNNVEIPIIQVDNEIDEETKIDSTVDIKVDLDIKDEDKVENDLQTNEEVPSIEVDKEPQVEEDKVIRKPVVVIEPVDEEVYPDDLNPFGDEEEESKPANKNKSTNPFGSDSDEEEDITLRKAQPSPRKVIPVDAHLNPFWEDEENEEKQVKPVPRPRSLR